MDSLLLRKVQQQRNRQTLGRGICLGGMQKAGTTLKDWAGKTLPDLERHLEMAQNLEK
jgi:hypothetical protein